ncbi:MAG: endonuclease/exonuclease/phosphatase family protein [Clostridia bacterium]|nr:endonuclease/exonuclease/phosphatase family protein [Clostridia bacterium]
MKIMSFNTQHCLNYLEKRVDYDIMAKTILDLGADIVGLNEMFDQGSEFGKQTEKLSSLTGLENHYFAKACAIGNEGEYGNGFLSRYKIVKAEAITIPDPNPRQYNGYYETRCVLKALLENGVTVLVCHFGLNPDEQENAVKTILENLEDKKCILMGDFNVEPDNLVLSPLYERLVDTADYFENDQRKSFPSDTPTIKIDYIFVTPDIEVVSADIPHIIASDHCPHIAEALV